MDDDSHNISALCDALSPQISWIENKAVFRPNLSLPLSYSNFKDTIRRQGWGDGIKDDFERLYFWPFLVHINYNETVSELFDMQAIAMKRYEWFLIKFS
jgi:hypothetical protein